MRSRLLPILIVVALATAATVFAAITANPASGRPTQTQDCTNCHSGAPSGTVTATPSTTTPAPGATYTVAINIGLTASGNTGYHVAQTASAGGAITSWTSVLAGPAAQTSWTATMTAPTAPGTYYYRVWCVKGPSDNSGMAKSVDYSITLSAAVPTPAISSLSPTSGLAGSSVTIAGSGFGATKGTSTVRFGSTTAATTAWSASSITATVPAGLSAGNYTVTVVTGGGTSNGMTFTVTAPPTSAPSISAINPTSGLAGSSVTITGSNFGSSGTVSFSGTTASTSAWSASSITATVPPGLSTGAKSVTVTTGGQASNAVTFTVTAPTTGDSTPPTTTASGAIEGGWYRQSVTVHLAAVDDTGGSGVASITYSIDGGAPVTVNGSAVDVRIGGREVTKGLDGPHTLAYFATDVTGNVEDRHSLTVNIDTKKPRPRTAYSATARRYATATLKYQVNDAVPNGGTAKVVIAVRDRKGETVKVLKVGTKPVNTLLKATFRCSLRPGTYRFYVRATDRAGNPQESIPSNTLTVYKAVRDDD